MKRPLSLALLFVAVVPSFFLLLVVHVVGDYGLFVFINREIINSVLDVACAYASPVFFFVFYFFTLVKLFVSKRSMSMAGEAISLVTGPLSYGVGSFMKLLFERPRPFEVLIGVRVIGPWDTSSFSFPSTTTMLVFGFSLPILLLFEKRWYGAILSLLSYFIGFSVVYTGFHFPADVAAGTLFSVGIALCTSRMNGLIVKFLGKLRTHSFS